jgi:hypothetical protein
MEVSAVGLTELKPRLANGSLVIMQGESPSSCSIDRSDRKAARRNIGRCISFKLACCLVAEL